MAVLAVVGLYALALLWKNSSQRASIWYWPGSPAEETNMMVLALAAFVSGGLMWGLASALLTLRRTRAARRKRAVEFQREEMERKASMLRVKPAPAPIVRPRVEPKPVPTQNVPGQSKPIPTPAVEPTPEGTLAPSPVVVIEQPKPIVEPVPVSKAQPAVESPPPASSPLVQSVLAPSASVTTSEPKTVGTDVAASRVEGESTARAKLDDTSKSEQPSQTSV